MLLDDQSNKDNDLSSSNFEGSHHSKYHNSSHDKYKKRNISIENSRDETTSSSSFSNIKRSKTLPSSSPATINNNINNNYNNTTNNSLFAKLVEKAGPVVASRLNKNIPGGSPNSHQAGNKLVLPVRLSSS